MLLTDEKSQIQALSRTQRPLSTWLLPARGTHDYTRHGTTSLLAALEMVSGKVHDRCFRRHRHVEFIAFLNSLARRYPGREIHPICDNYGTHRHSAVKQWLAGHPVARITEQALRRGSFDSVRRLEQVITRWLEKWNQNARPSLWTKSAAAIKRSSSSAALIYDTRHWCVKSSNATSERVRWSPVK